MTPQFNTFAKMDKSTFNEATSKTIVALDLSKLGPLEQALTVHQSVGPSSWLEIRDHNSTTVRQYMSDNGLVQKDYDNLTPSNKILYDENMCEGFAVDKTPVMSLREENTLGKITASGDVPSEDPSKEDMPREDTAEESIRGERTLRTSDIESTPNSSLVEFHHLNFHREAVYHKSATPPEVSLWLIITSGRRGKVYHGFSRKRIILSQAGKLIDPVMYRGPLYLLERGGTALRDALTGYVDKVYQPVGTWGRDLYSYDEVVPVCMRSSRGQCDGEYFIGPPKGYRISRSEGDILVNDDGRVHLARINQENVSWRRSKLCQMQNLED
ncbi:hypothetical protein MMC13_000937 [Lambiella insularis]|nr:hypothetical protein [Lambiella insularis]